MYGRAMCIATIFIVTFGLNRSCASTALISMMLSNDDRRKLRYSNTAVELQCLRHQKHGGNADK
uniref:Uncharacterized protein n=1 Tax=virus sp. ctQiC1 TaxID=2825817 RepID=A0A8S5RMV8_9VIRU|nr:MAG TPA: hypothetical protein [virus sp. ctQiC1]